MRAIVAPCPLCHTGAVVQVYLDYQGDSIELPIGETLVGRDVGCALRFNDPGVSRRHLRFVRREDEVFIEDLGSSNGTLLNGRTVTAPRRLQALDTIRVGGRIMVFRILDDDDLAESTLLVKSLEAASAQRSNSMRAVTTQLSVVLAPRGSGHQKCPRCGEPVSELDDECAGCHYAWGDFRPMTVTDVRPNPVTLRRHDRHPIELRLVYVSAELEIEAMTRDLSESGVFVCSHVLDPIGTACQLTILVDGGPPLRIGGIVRRVVDTHRSGGEPTGLGVEFVGATHNELTWIRAVAARMATDDQAAQQP